MQQTQTSRWPLCCKSLNAIFKHHLQRKVADLLHLFILENYKSAFQQQHVRFFYGSAHFLHLRCEISPKCIQLLAERLCEMTHEPLHLLSFLLLLTISGRVTLLHALVSLSANQDNTLNLHSPHACCYCLILACVCVCVFTGVRERATWHPQSLGTHRGVWDSENPPKSCSTRDARSCTQHKGLCTPGSWWCSWSFLFHLLHFETSWQQHFTDPRSVSVKLKTER